jgi:hypothetical protein
MITNGLQVFILPLVFLSQRFIMLVFTRPADSARFLRQRLAQLLSCLLLVAPAALHARPPHYALPTAEAPVALLPVGRATYLVTTHSVFDLSGRQPVLRYHSTESAAAVRCALATDSVLWLGTEQGLLRLRIGRGAWAARPLALPAPAGPAPVTALVREPGGGVWAGFGGYGAYRVAGNELVNALRIPAITSGLATVDSSVWLGTNLGLHRWQHGTWTRYNEEGVANHEIPDNLVEKLLLDNSGSLWVFMSDAITVFESLAARPVASAGHLPTVKYLGRPGNEVYSVAYLPGRGHVFATGMGLLLLPAQAPGELAHFDSATDKVETPQVLVPLAAAGAAVAGPCLLHVDARQRIWVVQAGSVQVLRAADFQPAAPRATAHAGR